MSVCRRGASAVKTGGRLSVQSANSARMQGLPMIQQNADPFSVLNTSM